jgi:hypothetical protein
MKEQGITEVAMSRDPRQFPWGIFTGSSFVLSSSRVFMWFESKAELASFLANDLSDGYGFDDDYNTEFKVKVAPLARRVEHDGLVDALLADINSAIKDDIVIDWWGNFEELKENRTEFARGIANGFIDDGDQCRSIADDELDDFVEYLQTCAV